MAPSPKKYETLKSTGTTISPAKTVKPVPPKKVPNCFAMNNPPKPGMIPVSTDQVKDGCFVLGWQDQRAVMLVSDAPQWYEFAGKILKAQLVFSAVFALALLAVLVIKRDTWRR